MPGENILVTFGSVQEASQDCMSIAGQVETQLSDLKAYLRPLVATWQGQASTDYQALQAQWDTSAADLQAVLVQIAQALEHAHGNYTQTETTNASMWR